MQESSEEPDCSGLLATDSDGSSQRASFETYLPPPDSDDGDEQVDNELISEDEVTPRSTQLVPSRLRPPKFMAHGYMEPFDDDLNNILEAGVESPPTRSIQMLEEGRLSVSARAGLFHTTEAQVKIWDDEDGQEGGLSDGDDDDDDLAFHEIDKDRNGDRYAASHQILLDWRSSTDLPPTETENSTRDEDSLAISDAFGKGWVQGIKLLMRAEMQRCRLPEEHRTHIVQHVYAMFATMHHKVFQGHMNGNLEAQDVEDQETSTELRKIRNRVIETSQPAIYRQALVDDRGKSPTPNQLLSVLDDIEHHYLSPDPDPIIVASIDSFKNPKSSRNAARQGYRKYLARKPGSPCSRSRIHRLDMFCSKLRKRLLSIPHSDRDQPLKEPLSEMGYSMEVLKRLKRHRDHQNSNFIMNLFEAACERLYPGVFSIKQNIIFLIFDKMHASLSEIALTALGQGYIFNAGGFSFHPAGQNNATANRFSDDLYKTWRIWAMKSSDTTYQNHSKLIDQSANPHADQASLVDSDELMHENSNGHAELTRIIVSLRQDIANIEHVPSSSDVSETGDER